jgi:hypothetical protein
MLKQGGLNKPVAVCGKEVEKPPAQPLELLSFLGKLVGDLFGEQPGGHTTGSVDTEKADRDCR